MISSTITPPVRSMPVIFRRLVLPSAIIPGSNNFVDKIGPFRTNAVSKPTCQGHSLSLIQNGLPIIEWPKDISELHEEDDLLLQNLLGVKDQWQMINEVKGMLGAIGNGEISMSAYDAAWVVLVQSLEGNGKPQFPSCLQWIVNNQLADGSWGEAAIFSAHDRIINTLGCVIALESWGVFPEKCDRGLMFIRENMWRLGEEEDELMPIGFEVTFPSLLDKAKALGLQIPYDDPALLNIYSKRNLKLKRIPKEVMHEVPTTLLHSLEGMQDLDWNKLLTLQSMDGSFLFSPSSTACALMQTGNKKCLEYLQRIVDKFNGGVPSVYPADLFEHLWIVDRLERLGISRYFQPEIKECLDYVYRYWTKDGICWARNSRVQDLDDTSMAFRLLRLHGYDVSPDAFKNFEMDGEFFCFAGQTTQATTGIYNLNRASQVMFSNEKTLDRAKKFSYKFLREKQATSQLLDKWIITKDLRGEVEYALDFPFYASLPRVETRWFIEQYGGRDDIWIGKTLYRMPLVNNNLYLDLAKADFNQCQAIHQLEWLGLQKWYEECNLAVHHVTRKSMLKAYFLATACIFEPDRATERLGWAKTSVLAEAVAFYFRNESCTEKTRQEFIFEFRNGNVSSAWKRTEGLVGPVLQLIDHLATWTAHQQLLPHQQQIHHHLRQAWDDWMSRWSADEDETGMLLARTIELCKGRVDLIAQLDFMHFAKLTSSICNYLQRSVCFSKGNINNKECAGDEDIESRMQELVSCVLQKSDSLSNQSKHTFLSVAKSYYYATHCSLSTLNNHITKVLFERTLLSRILQQSS